MTNRRAAIWWTFILMAVCLQTAIVSAAPVHIKPQHPLQLNIAPAPGTDLAAVKAGDVIDLAATATLSHDAADMRITVKLSDGVELVRGDLAWSGPAKKLEPRSVRFSVRVPEKGVGRIRAQASITAGGKKELTAKAQYLLMTATERQEQQKMKTEKPVKKDSKGRPIVEY
ncbi:MAG: hypothetical protein ACYC7L_07940 [Nitrospirota bacterium]